MPTAAKRELVFSIDGQSGTYIVHMDLSFMPRAFTSHQRWFSATLSSISNSGFVYAYTNAIHGFSAVLSPTELKTIKKSPGYLYSIKDALVKVDTSHASGFLGLSSDHGACPVTDYGLDVIIGVIDTEVWPESKSFGDDGMGEIPARWKEEFESATQFSPSMSNKKFIGAHYFNRGLLAKNPNLTTISITLLVTWTAMEPTLPPPRASPE
ncbi:PREDICTED: subtilisin-like protease SBT1.9 [Ipomoea nil]|uniref:subtilisin-like protease SBT1.9 n=1 Tax=Ipomoea nil TaxID=35883 RepID=UPI00090190D8|nr:PREDICTED: subtilisin-like protease SBT1.9 [Ipomoea nil]